MTDVSKIALGPINDMMSECARFESSLFPPTEPIKDGERVLGLVPEDLRRMFAYSRYCDRERKQLQVDMEFDTEKDPQKIFRLWQLNKRHDIALALFYFCLWEYFEAYDESAQIGVRKDWQVIVRDPGQDGEMPSFFRHIFGIGGPR